MVSENASYAIPNERGSSMSIYVGQLPPAEMARFKAELAETLIAHFCYPRFFDYRTNSLRSRPVDRTKRQEVWLYLSAYDFTSWNKVDLQSVDIQRHVERIFIQFIQRNRSFFGEQGRKRMSDIRLLIGSSASTVVQGLREHVSGHHQGSPPFGSPRPVASWSSPHANGYVEPTWETMAPITMLLQQQVQEVRNEHPSLPSPSIPQSDPYPFNPHHPDRVPTTGALERDVTPVQAAGTNKKVAAAQSNGHRTSSAPEPRVTQAPAIAWSAAPTAPVPSVAIDPLSLPLEIPAASANGGSASPQAAISVELDTPHTQTPEKNQSHAASPTTSAIVPQSLPSSSMPKLAPNQRTNSATLINEEDIAIFEQLRLQLIVWLRIEAIRSNIEIANLTPSQLMEQLCRNEKCDETRLQIVSTLLNLANQVIKSGYASPFDYKQALMFHLMHTKR
jgi:hypothetical protein